MRFLLLLALLLGPLDKLSLTVSPTVSFGPEVNFTIIIPPKQENRYFCFGWFGDSDRRSCQQLEGEKAAKVYFQQMRVEGAGDFVAFLEVGTANGKSETITRNFKIIPRVQ